MNDDVPKSVDPPEPTTGTAPDLPPEDPANRAARVRARLDSLRSKEGSFASKITGLIITGVLFLVVAGTSWKPAELAIMVGVMLLHEAGHALGMIAFGYRNVSMFFLPGIGAAVTGRKTRAKAWQEAVVSLLGPMPGALLGVGLLVLNARNWQEPLVNQAAVYLLLLNLFNLLPFVPFDGGNFMDKVLFARNPRLEMIFGMVGVLGIGALALWMKSPGLGIVAGFAFFMLRGNARVNELVALARKTSEPGAESVNDETLIALDNKVAEIYPQAPVERRDGTLDRVISRLTWRPAGGAATALLLAIYLAPSPRSGDGCGTFGSTAGFWPARYRRLPPRSRSPGRSSRLPGRLFRSRFRPTPRNRKSQPALPGVHSVWSIPAEPVRFSSA